MSGNRNNALAAMDSKPPSANANARNKTEPQDASIVHSILQSMGVEACEPRVVQQLLEFQYKYTTQVSAVVEQGLICTDTVFVEASSSLSRLRILRRKR